MLKDYLFPETIDAAVAMLRQFGGKARIIAGGTDLVLDAEKLHPAAEYFIDITRIEALNGIRREDDYIVIGANVTHTQCHTHPLIAAHAPALASASARVGSTQIRNLGTVVGNIVRANPAADAATALTALEAVCVVRGFDGIREIPITDMYRGVGRSVVDSASELVLAVKFPVKSKNGSSAYETLTQREALSLPMCAAAVKVRLSGNLIQDAVVVATPLAPGPTRIAAVEEYLRGKEAGNELFKEAGRLATDNVSFRSSPTRGSAAYRHEVLPYLVQRALLQAVANAKE